MGNTRNRRIVSNNQGRLVDNLPNQLKQVYNKLTSLAQDLNIKLYLVGGSVRDLLLGSQPKDIDFMIPSKEEKDIFLSEAVNRIPGTKLIEQTGTQFFIDILKIDGIHIEIASARGEDYSSDSRKPTVTEGNIYTDANRRDFGINAIFYDTSNNGLIDLTGHGIQDIKDKTIRAAKLGDEDILMDQDPLRMYRAIRFAITKGFSIDESLKEAIKRNIHKLDEKGISKNRVREEINKILKSPNSSQGIRLLKELGLWDYTFSNHESLGIKDWNMDQNNPWHKLDVLNHSLLVLENLDKFLEQNKDDLSYPEEKIALYKIVAILHDVGKLDPNIEQKNDRGFSHYHGHEGRSRELADQILSDLQYSNDEKDVILNLIGNHMRTHNIVKMFTEGKLTDKALRKFVRELKDDVYGMLDIAYADSNSKDYDIEKDYKPYQEIKEKIKNLDIKETVDIQAPVDGNELQQYFNLPPGPWIKEIKDFQINQMLEDPNTTKEKMWEMIKGNFTKDMFMEKKQSMLSDRGLIVEADDNVLLKLPHYLSRPLSIIKEVATSSGLDIYLTGGTVRDMLLGETPSSDLDILIDKQNGDIELANKLRALYPTIKIERSDRGDWPAVFVFIDQAKIDLVSPHYITKEGGRIVVKDATLEQDAKRRDFGINSLFYDLQNDKLIDLSGQGIEDFEANILRLQQPAELIFMNDPRTPLKAIRLATLKGFELGSDLKQSIRENVDVLNYAEAKQIKKELDKILYSVNSRSGLLLMEEVGILDYLKKHKDELDLDDFLLDPDSPLHKDFNESSINSLIDI